MTPKNLHGRDAVIAALTSDDLAVPSAPADQGPPSLAWLRANVVRFSEGADHRRRRGYTETVLAGTVPANLRRAASRHTTEILAAAESTVDLMAQVARRVPVRVLADALGVADHDATVPADVAIVARQYLTGPEWGESTGAADAAVVRLVQKTGADGERAAAIVGVLAQSYEATAGLIGNACVAALRDGAPRGAGRRRDAGAMRGSDDEAATVVTDTLRHNPPTLSTRRLATVDTTVADVHIGAREVVRVDLASAGLALGAGHHGCPGADQARAIAAGVVDAVRGWRLVDATIGYIESPYLRVPSRLVITAGWGDRMATVEGSGTRDDPWQLTTPPGTSAYQMYRDETNDPPILVCTVGKTVLHYDLRCIEDLHAMLREHGDWMPLGAADEQKPAAESTVEAWGRSPHNPIDGWYGLKKGFRGRFGMYVPPLLEALGLAEVEHNPRNNRMRAI